MNTLTSLQPLGGTEVLVLFEPIPGEPAGRRESSTDGPATPDAVAITGVMLNGEEIDASFFAPALVEKWSHLIQLEMHS